MQSLAVNCGQLSSGNQYGRSRKREIENKPLSAGFANLVILYLAYPIPPINP
jgi:hypothetical protein